MARFWIFNAVEETQGAIEADSEDEAIAKAKAQGWDASRAEEIESGKGGRV